MNKPCTLSPSIAHKETSSSNQQDFDPFNIVVPSIVFIVIKNITI